MPMKMRILSILLAACLLTGCAGTPGTSGEGTAPAAPVENAVNIALSDTSITVDGAAVSGDPAAAVYAAHDIVYYEAGHDFTYGEGTEQNAHTAEEAAAHTVVHITQPGRYALSGSLSAGQIAVDLGEEAKDDPDAQVTLILNGVDITCTVAPAVIFYNVYECGSDDADTAVKEVDTSAAGAKVILADGTENAVSGSYVARIYKEVTLSEDGTEVVDSKKLHKYDAAFYSRMSMELTGGEAGDGVLDIRAENEGLDSELHLTLNGSDIRITSGNDGINTNEDGVSVTCINGGSLNIQVTGETGEGDGVDSNGWLVINGGRVRVAAFGKSADGGLDADMGVYLNGGDVMATGNMYDPVNATEQVCLVATFGRQQPAGTVFTMKNADGETVGEWTLPNEAGYLLVSHPDWTEGSYTLWQGDTQLMGIAGGGFGGGKPGGMGHMAPPEGFELPEGFEGQPEGFEMMGPPEGFEGSRGDRPQLPEGTEPMTPPEDFAGERPQRPEGEKGRLPGFADAGVPTDTFPLSRGINLLSDVG